MSDGFVVSNKLAALPTWLWSPKDADTNVLVSGILKQIGRASTALPTADDSWCLYRTMTNGMNDEDIWMDNSARAWLLVSACYGFTSAIETLCGYIHSVTEDGLLSSLTRTPAIYPTLLTRIKRGEWKDIQADVLMSWSKHAEKFVGQKAYKERQDDGWTGSEIPGFSTELKEAIEREKAQDFGMTAAKPSKMLVHNFSVSTAIDKDLKSKYENVLLKPVPIQKPLISAREFREKFLMKFPWATSVAEVVYSHITLREVAASRDGYIPPLPHMLLVGPSGAAKSTMLEEICNLLGVSNATLSVGGAADDCGLAGTGQKWNTRMPSIPVQLMARENCANPVLIIDEIDKSVGNEGRNGSVQGSLLSMMQPPQEGYRDNCLGVPVDFSGVSFLATANSTSRMDAAIISRFKVVQVNRPKPTTENFWCLLKGLSNESADQFGLTIPGELPGLPDRHILEAYRVWIQSGCDIRVLKQAYTESMSRLLTLWSELPDPSGPEATMH